MLTKLNSRNLQQALKPTSLLLRTAACRTYGQMTKECADHLTALGITNKNIVFNPS